MLIELFVHPIGFPIHEDYRWAMVKIIEEHKWIIINKKQKSGT